MLLWERGTHEKVVGRGMRALRAIYHCTDPKTISKFPLLV